MPPLKRTDLKRIHLSLDGKPVLAREGQTILDVAREYGVRIPTLCYHPKLEPIGACRLCIVTVDGARLPVTACTTKVAEGMSVVTTSPAIESLRRETLKLILLKHPMNCTACEINGRCALQDLAFEYDIAHEDLHSYEIKPIEYPTEPYATPLIRYHPRRCVLCGRCVQACTEIIGASAITFKGRGVETRIGPIDLAPGQENPCISCGECMSVCPVNALTEAMGKPKGKPWETRQVETICGYCGCGCTLQLDVVNDQVVGVSSAEGGVNDGELCAKGRFGYDFVSHKDRLRQPLIRRNGYWEETNWDEALDYVAERLADIRAQYGADAIGGLSSARCTNEDNYLFQKFVRGVLGTNNVDHCARL